MNTRLLSAAIALALSAGTSCDLLASQRIEARFFPRDSLDLGSQWLVQAPRPGMDPALANQMVAQSDFTELRLTIPDALAGKKVRIFLVLPISTQGISGSSGLEAEWKTQGIFLNGSARPGDRVLFFSGLANVPLLRDLVAYTFRIDARYANGDIRFEPEYEIEQE